jgi:hypothetical protein
VPAPASDSGLPRLYERGVEAKSAPLREKPRAQGIVPVDPGTESLH